MRNIHQHIKAEYGVENVKLFQQWERLECKMADFQNHRRFSVRCLSAYIIPVSIKLKSNIRSPKHYSIIKGAEKALLNEIIRTVKNTITMFEIQIDTCMNQLKGILDKETMEECMVFIKVLRESRHIRTQKRQIIKCNQLCHKNTGGCSNHLHGNHGEHDQQQHETPVPESSNININYNYNSNRARPTED